MICFPNAKINIGLNIKRKRPDGFHDLETIFYPVPWSDVLEIVRLPEQSSSTCIKLSGINIPGSPETNLCLKAYELLAKDHKLPAVGIFLHKIIPTGAGLGGGSSNGAFVIKAINELFSLSLSSEKMEEYAVKLGSDCAFFIRNKPVFASGRGEKFEDINLNLNTYSFTLIKPPVSISTREAFAGVIPSEPAVSVKELINLPVEEWRNHIFNDFEKTIFKAYPSIAAIKESLYKEDALYASMSGSGSAVYGIFREKKNIAGLFPDCEVFQA